MAHRLNSRAQVFKNAWSDMFASFWVGIKNILPALLDLQRLNQSETTLITFVCMCFLINLQGFAANLIAESA